MFVKNTSAKTIGFGKVYIEPGATIELPAEYGKNHNTVNWYLIGGLLTVVDEKTEKAAAAKKAEEDEAKKAEAAKQADLKKKISALNKLNLDSLKELAKSLEVEIADSDTIAILRGKITEKYQSE